jgi:hypothetical protein
MRAVGGLPDAWRERWIAGFTSRSAPHCRHWLYYLARVADAYESHADLWQHLPKHVRGAKCAQRHFLGDVFAPVSTLSGADRFDPARYPSPLVHSHRLHGSDTSWHDDIRYPKAAKYGQSPLLVADPYMTFLWSRPQLCIAGKLGQGFRKAVDVQDLVGTLDAADGCNRVE